MIFLPAMSHTTFFYPKSLHFFLPKSHHFFLPQVASCKSLSPLSYHINYLLISCFNFDYLPSSRDDYWNNSLLLSKKKIFFTYDLGKEKYINMSDHPIPPPILITYFFFYQNTKLQFINLNFDSYLYDNNLFYPTLLQLILSNTITMSATTTTERPTILVDTTLPLLGVDKWSTPIISNRLIIRSLLLKDLEGYHALYSQPEPMALGYVSGAEPFGDLKVNLDRLINSLRPWATSDLHYGIFMKIPDDKEGELIGHCRLNIGTSWPYLSYIFRKEYWGQGYGTEAVKAFMLFWWSLPRSGVRLRVYPGSVDIQEVTPYQTTPSTSSPLPKVRELVLATVERGNGASKSVLLKAGFESVEAMDEGELNHFRYIIPQKTPQFFRDIYFNRG